MKTLPTYLLVALFLSGLILMPSCLTEDPTAPEATSSETPTLSLQKSDDDDDDDEDNDGDDDAPLSGLIACYPFDGNANDESGNGFHATVNGATLTTDRFGNPSSAFSFDGIDDFLSVPHDEAFNFGTGDFTLVGWFYLNQIPLPTRDLSVIQKFGFFRTGPDRGDGFGYTLLIPSSGIPLVNVQESGVGDVAIAQDPLVTDQWFLLVGLRRNGTLELYVDGDLKDSQSSSRSPDNEAPFDMGADINSLNPADSRWLDGRVDDVRVYNQALSAEEIKDIFDADSAPECRPEDDDDDDDSDDDDDGGSDDDDDD